MKWTRKQERIVFRLAASALILLFFVILKKIDRISGVWYVQVPLFLIPYAIAGWDVLANAVINLSHRQVLDETFLMSVATVGAFAIGEYPEAVFVMLFYQLGELFQSIAVGKSRRSIAELMKIRPDEARVLRDGVEYSVDPATVRIGEVLLIRPGEKIPLDGVVVKGKSDLNTASLTGESEPRSVSEGDPIYSGCINLSRVLEVRVEKKYEESTVAKILELVENSALSKSKAERAITKFARRYTPAVVAAAVFIAIVPSFLTGDWIRWLRSALIFLVVSCPCALVISIPLSYFGGLGAASKEGILIKGANYLEALKDTGTVVFDKTGTLTEGSFRISAIHPESGITAEKLLLFAATAEQKSNHPIARSLITAADAELLPIEDVEEISGRGISASVGTRKLLVGNAKLMESNRIPIRIPPEVGSAVYVAVDGTYFGSIVISDKIKESAVETMLKLKQMGIRKTVMLTGDRQTGADYAAKVIGVDDYAAELFPQDKVSRVEGFLKEQTGTVVFVGDGVNDAPVLARADVGIAMGAIGSDAAMEAADIVLMDDDPRKIPKAIQISRYTSGIVRQNIFFALGVKAGFLLLALFGMTNLWAATFADVGVSVIAILNAMRTLTFRE